MSSRGQSSDPVVDFLSELAVGVVTCRLYSVEHPRALRARRRIAERCEELLGAAVELPEISSAAVIDLTVVDDEVFLGERTVTREGEEMALLVRSLHRHRVDQVSLEGGVSREEIGEFVGFLAGPPLSSPPRLPHIRIRRPVVVQEVSEEGGEAEIGDLDLEQRLHVVSSLVEAVVAGTPPPMTLLYGMVQQLDERLQRTSNPLRHMAELTDRRGWVVIHAHNTAVLSLALAVLFLDDPSSRHDLGVAAILHDVGKFGLPQEIIDQDLALSGLEWELNYDHPRIGLERLLAIPRVPQVAQIVAFDHHLTQRGGYPTLPEPRAPHPAAALVAVAEAVDIMATVRLPRERIDREEIASTLRAGEGGAFEPTFATAMAALWEIVQ